MATYCEMLTRTSTAQIYHQGKSNEYLAHGEDLVLVTHHVPTCKKCAPWGGKVLSLTGETPGYPTMDDARAAGLFHPNCRHTYSLFQEGIDDELVRAEEYYLPMEEYRDNKVLKYKLFNPDKVFFDLRKLSEYALSKDSERGKHKAIIFKKVLGFEQKNAETLKLKVLDALPSADI